jgi:hypothetical protein
MSTAYATLDQVATSPYQNTRQPLAETSGQQPGDSSSYVGLHRRRDGQGPDTDSLLRQPAHLPRHRRPS